MELDVVDDGTLEVCESAAIVTAQWNNDHDDHTVCDCGKFQDCSCNAGQTLTDEHIYAVGHSDADLELHVTADDGALEFSDVEAVQQNNDGNDRALCDICGKCEGCSCNSAQMITNEHTYAASPTPTNMELPVTDDGTKSSEDTVSAHYKSDHKDCALCDSCGKFDCICNGDKKNY